MAENIETIIIKLKAAESEAHSFLLFKKIFFAFINLSFCLFSFTVGNMLGAEVNMSAFPTKCPVILEQWKWNVYLS